MSAFMMVCTVWSVSCLLFFYCSHVPMDGHGRTADRSRSKFHQMVLSVVLSRLPKLNRKPRFFLSEPWRTDQGFLGPSEDGFAIRLLYLYSVKLHEQTDKQTYKYALQICPPRSPPSHRVDVWRRCNLWTVSRKTDGRTGIKLGAF